MDSLLFLSQRIPYPPDKGDKIRSFHSLEYLAKRCRIHLGCFVDDPADMRHVPALEAMCESVLALPLPRTLKLARSALAFAKGKSISETCFHDRRMTHWISTRPNVRKAFVFCSAMAPYLLNANIEKIVDMADVDSEKWRTYAENSAWPLSGIYAREARKLLALERRSGLAFNRTLFVSAEEASAFLRLVPEAEKNVLAMANGVDAGYFDPAGSFASPFSGNAKPIVFTGAMNYRPNVDAVRYFVRDILPSIRARDDAAEFWIVGAQPAPSVEALRSPHIHVTGQVPDVRPYLAHAACVVAPLRIARGIQNKVLEAMAMARPVVATPEAHEGINATPSEEILVAGTAPSFAEAACSVLSGAHREMGGRARAFVQAHHSWRENLKILDTLLVTPDDKENNRKGDDT